MYTITKNTDEKLIMIKTISSSAYQDSLQLYAKSISKTNCISMKIYPPIIPTYIHAVTTMIIRVLDDRFLETIELKKSVKRFPHRFSKILKCLDVINLLQQWRWQKLSELALWISQSVNVTHQCGRTEWIFFFSPLQGLTHWSCAALSVWQNRCLIKLFAVSLLWLTRLWQVSHKWPKNWKEKLTGANQLVTKFYKNY